MLAPKLGLALSGGGFRASFFHLGALRRLAELDLLRGVAMLSTVSGGSIVAGQYVLRLRAALGRAPRLTRDQYVDLVKQVEADFRDGTARNLRTLLFSSPFANLTMLLSRSPLGRRMARLYQRHLYAGPGRDVDAAWQRRVPLEQTRFVPAGQGQRDAIPKWVINATSLNSGRGFRFTMAEVGDPILGYIRFDEVRAILECKRFLARARAGRIEAERSPLRDRSGWHLSWWLAVQDALAAERRRPDTGLTGRTSYGDYARSRGGATDAAPAPVRILLDDWLSSNRLATAEFGLLRKAKISAWRLAARPERPSDEGRAIAEQMWDALEDIGLAAATLDRLRGAPADSVFAFLIDAYLLRSAEAFAWTAEAVLKGLTVADAVAASANFPPVFPPLTIFGLYDPERVWALGLTDGGVYDNQGLDALLDEGCTHIIASDAGGLLAVASQPAAGRLGMMTRIADSLTANVRDLQLRDLRHRRRVTAGVAEVPASVPGPELAELRSRYGLKAVAFFHMTSDPDDGLPESPVPPLRPHPGARAAARLRTDLDAFHDTEIDTLMYQGYQLADRFVRRFLEGEVSGAFVRGPAAPVFLPAPGDDEAWRRVRRVLEAGRARFLRVFKLNPVAGVIAVGLVAVAVGAAVTGAPVSLSQVGRWVGAWIAVLAQRPWIVPVGGLPLANSASAWWIGGAVVALAAGWVTWPRVEVALGRRLAALRPEVAWKAWALRFVGRLGLWRRWIWLAVFLLPIWAAFGAALLAWANLGLDVGARRLLRVGRRPP